MTEIISNKDKLRSQVFDNNLRINAYSTDASNVKGVATGVFTPMSVKEVSDIIKTNPKITIRGGGSGVRSGAVPDLSAVLDLSKMDKIIDIDPIRNIVNVESGIILEELNYELERWGLEFPIIPHSKGVCTIGGMIATNASGVRSVKYKRMADFVVELEIIDGSGKEKKISRVDASNFVGMEGITGVIVSAKLKVIKKPYRSITAYRSNDLFKIIELTRKLKLSKDVSMIFLIDPLLSQIVGLERIYHLIIEFESDQGELKGEFYNNKLRFVQNLPMISAKSGYSRIEDFKIFLDKFEDFSSYLKDNQIPYYANLGSGLIHPLLKTGSDELIKDMYKFVRRIRGTIAGTFGIGKVKCDFMDVNDKKLVQRVKKRYDPLNKLNSGVIIDADVIYDSPKKEVIDEMIKEIDRQERLKEESS